jgi:hypothetical protein
MSKIDIQAGDVILSSGAQDSQVRIQKFSPWNGASIVIPWANSDRLVSQVSIDTFFCAELVATAYQQLGILLPPPQGRNANNYIPGDFSEEQELLDLDRRYLFTSQQSIYINYKCRLI